MPSTEMLWEVWGTKQETAIDKKSVDISKFNRKKLMGTGNDFLC